MARSQYLRVLVGVAVACGLAATEVSAQITTGSVTGVVTDAQSGVIPGASIVLISETQGTRTAPVVTSADGSYTVPNVKADTYSVEVTMPSFKVLTRKGVRVSGGDRIRVEALVLQIGGQTENVMVLAEAPVIQAASGERSGVIQGVQLQNLPSGTGHNFTEFLNLIPGVSATNGTANRVGGSGQTNFMIDGISAMDTGNNGLMGGLNLPVDQVAEVKVITSGSNAEFGRSIGLQVSAVTKSGTNQFRGSLYDYERHSDWNSNSWANQKNGNPKGISDQRDWGYAIGGPVGKPGGNNKLFFFYSSEYRPRTAGNNTTNLRLPTAAERRGDFSQTVDNNGNSYTFIYDPNNAGGLAKTSCSSTVQTACFNDGAIGRIPISRLYGPGIALLNQYPLPNCPGAACPNWTPTSSYNWSNLSETRKTLQWLPTYRVDYQLSSNFRMTGKWSGTSGRVQPTPGSIPGFNDTINKFPLSFNTSATVNYSLSPTMFMEFTYGVNQNRLGTPNISDASNRNNVVCPADLKATIANCTLGGIAFPFTGDIAVNDKYYEFKALNEIGVPFLVGNTFQMPPTLNWAVNGTTSRLGNNTPPSLNFPGFMNINRTQDFSISMTKVLNRHTMKAGFYLNHSYKAQNFGAGGNGAPSFQGALNFGQDTNNPLDSGFGYANAALGIFASYGQQSAFIEGSFLYNNAEWYVQDNWKVDKKLTLDYGVRFVHQTPQYDQFNQVSTFRPDTWSLSKAPYLYVPGCVGNTATCSGNNRVAKDPRTGALLPVGTSSLVGSVILGSGDGANGLTQAGNGIANTGYVWPWLGVAPRLGVAYDLTGQQKAVFRGSVGMFFDRPDGNSVFSTVGNPPVATSTQAQWGFLQTLQNTQFSIGPVPIVNSFQYESALPKDVQWNGGVQIALPWSSALDLEYVGHHAYDTLSAAGGASSTNINTIDVGTFLPGGRGIDPTATNGTTLNNNLVRAYRGYGNLNINQGRYFRTFHSLQASYNRRFSHGWQMGVNWTWAIYDVANSFCGNNCGPNLRIDHNADGTYAVRADQAQAQELFGNQGDTTHTVKGNFVWQLPTLPNSNALMRAIGLVANDWQLSGIFTIDSGSPYDLAYSYQSGGGTNLTGSPDYNARIVIPDVGAAGAGCSGDQYSQFTNAMVAGTGASPVRSTVFTGPQAGSAGLESGRNLFNGCGRHDLDLAIARNIKLGGGRTLQLRVDVFNALNTVVFNGRQGTIQFNSPTDQTVRNSQYRADGSIDPNRVTPNTAGFGAVTGARDLRSVQGQIRFTF